MITLTPLSASSSSSSYFEPVSYFLQLDDARILLDLGQRDYRASAAQSSWDYEEKIRELAPTLSLVLLSHSPSTYLSLYPYARARWGLKCPVYATQPTVEMGRVVCLAEAESWRAECAVNNSDTAGTGINGSGGPDGGVIVGDSSSTAAEKSVQPLKGPFVPTVEEIHEAFDWIKAIRYNQPLHLGGELSHLLLTPFPSGHVLGGTLFKIRSPTSGTILYAVGMNHTGERHLDGMVTGQGGLAAYAEDIRRPDLLIVEGGRSTIVNSKRRDRERALLDLVSSTLESGHSVLLPCDPSPRLLELLVLLDQHWSFKLNPTKQKRQGSHNAQGRWDFPLCLVSRNAQDMIAFARSLIEWMGGIVRDAEEDDVIMDLGGKKRKKRSRAAAAFGSEFGVLDFKHVQYFATPTDLIATHPLVRPKLVLAIPPTMSHGPSRWLFTIMAGMEGNVIVLTSPGENGTLAKELYNMWLKGQGGVPYGSGEIGKISPMKGTLELEMNAKVPLEGAELEAYIETERSKKEREAAHQAAVDRSRRMLEADDLESDSESESEEGNEVDGMVITRTEGANTFAGDAGGDDTRTMSFDIFVKGQQMRVGRTGGGGKGGEAMARFRMFPFIARGRRIDIYGEGLDIGQWVRKGREIEEEGETEEVREAKKRKQEEDEKAKQAPELPSKFVSDEVKVDLRASVFFVDMDGLHDGQAIKTIITDLQPRKLILVRSTADSTTALLEFFNSSSNITADVYHPMTGEVVRIGEHVQSYSLQLGDSMSSRVKWSKFEGYEVAMVDGRMAFAAGSTVPTLEASSVALAPVLPEVKAEEEFTVSKPTANNENITADVDLQVKAEPSDSIEISTQTQSLTRPQSQPSIPGPPAPLPTSLFIGDLRLLALKSRLAALSIPAEFAGEGVLICGPGVMARSAAGENASGAKAGSIVAVRKLAEGRVIVEGSLGKTYFDVRRELYASYAQVTAA